MLTISGTSDSEFTPFAECMISPFHYMYYRVLGLCVQINDSGLFAWISLTSCLRLILPMKFGKVAYLLR